jgi:hypothetical protein
MKSKKTDEGSKSLGQAYFDGAKTVVMFVGGIFLFRIINDIYDNTFSSNLKDLPPRK